MASITAQLLLKGLARKQILGTRNLLPRTLTPFTQNAFTLPERRVHISPRVQQAAANMESAHARHWFMERVVAGSLYAIIPAAYLMEPSFAMDTGLSSLLVLHAHWGIAAIFGDYVHGYPSNTGERRYPMLTTLSKILPYILSILAFACLMNFNYNDVGLVKAISMLWRV